MVQGTVTLLQSQAEEAAAARDAAVATCNTATQRAEAAAADATALLRTLRQQLDDARGHAAADAQRTAELEHKLQVAFSSNSFCNAAASVENVSSCGLYRLPVRSWALCYGACKPLLCLRSRQQFSCIWH